MKGKTLLWPIAALILVLLFNLIFSPSFFAVTLKEGHLYGSLIDIFVRAAPVVIVGLGMTLVIATGGVDLSVGAVMAIAGAVAACVIARPEGCILNSLPLGGSMMGIVGIALFAAILCGFLNGFLVSKLKLQPIVATLLLMVAGRGAAQLLTNGQIVTFSHPEFAGLSLGSFLTIPIPIWIAGLTLGAIALLIRATALGLFIESVGNNAASSEICGINPRTIMLLVYVLCGLCAGIAGLIAAADIKAADSSNAGLYLELDAILAAAIGGTALTGGRFYLVGTVIGALLMQAITTTINTYGVSTEVTFVFKGVVVIIVCLLQSPKIRDRAMKKLEVKPA